MGFVFRTEFQLNVAQTTHQLGFGHDAECLVLVILVANEFSCLDFKWVVGYLNFHLVLPWECWLNFAFILLDS